MAITVILNIGSAHLLETIDYIQSKSSQGCKAFKTDYTHRLCHSGQLSNITYEEVRAYKEIFNATLFSVP